EQPSSLRVLTDHVLVNVLTVLYYRIPTTLFVISSASRFCLEGSAVAVDSAAHSVAPTCATTCRSPSRNPPQASPPRSSCRARNTAKPATARARKRAQAFRHARRVVAAVS